MDGMVAECMDEPTDGGWSPDRWMNRIHGWMIKWIDGHADGNQIDGQ